MLLLLVVILNLDFITYGVIFKKQMVDIVPYPTKNQKLRQPAAEWLPSVPFLMSVSGPSMSGKGMLIQSLIMRPELYRDGKEIQFGDEIHYWTGSAKLDVNSERPNAS